MSHINRPLLKPVSLAPSRVTNVNENVKAVLVLRLRNANVRDVKRRRDSEDWMRCRDSNWRINKIWLSLVCMDSHLR